MPYRDRISARTLLASTAITLMASLPAAAQQVATGACLELEGVVASGLPTPLAPYEEGLGDVVAVGDLEQCRIVMAEIEGIAAGRKGAVADAVIVERQEAIVEMEKRIMISGQVLIDQKAPEVDVVAPAPQVGVVPGRARVAVREAAPEILVRQATPQIVVDMPQPAVTVTQPAPEVVVTMPRAGVDIDQAKPQVEVRQAPPTVTVEQEAPGIALDLDVAEGGDGVAIRDRRTGARLEDAAPPADVRMARGEPSVEVGSPPRAELAYEAAEPRVVVERARPDIRFTGTTEPRIAYKEAGEARVVIRRADAPDASQGVTATRVPAGMSASPDYGDLVGYSVHDTDGTEIGHIVDLRLGEDGTPSVLAVDIGERIGEETWPVKVDMSEVDVVDPGDGGDSHARRRCPHERPSGPRSSRAAVRRGIGAIDNLAPGSVAKLPRGPGRIHRLRREEEIGQWQPNRPRSSRGASARSDAAPGACSS